MANEPLDEFDRRLKAKRNMLIMALLLILTAACHLLKL